MKPADLVPRPEWYPGRARGGWLSARVGTALGIAFATCFVTGLISHFHQHPGLFPLPDGPVWGYAVSQGIHVTTGIASIPLLAVKLWSVAPGSGSVRWWAVCCGCWSAARCSCWWPLRSSSSSRDC